MPVFFSCNNAARLHRKDVHGGCNCRLTGFDVSVVRRDPVLAGLNNGANIRGGNDARLDDRTIVYDLR